MTLDLVLAAVLLVIGVGLVVLGVWLRLGRSTGARSWVDDVWPWRERFYLLLPVLGVIVGACAGFVLDRRGGDLAHACAEVIALPAVAVVVFGVCEVPMPRWSLPGWYRPHLDARKARERAQKERRRARKPARKAART
ncbi:hypothetical protein EV189_2354 [Motilibacter rhizosphaerae]|uniref:Uncharacterized protein n=1 Tax=Motilibacter rhizosphaerae TaxID=598652 RepID=A0A4Q7NPP4_9ACTN|nr:hypothetical protein [Motilibacter rhizosphaerae]RZS86936.1 hypothetical protein EV189_2354 [Motilibacter rhizosphaerae]